MHAMAAQHCKPKSTRSPSTGLTLESGPSPPRPVSVLDKIKQVRGLHASTMARVTFSQPAGAIYGLDSHRAAWPRRRAGRSPAPSAAEEVCMRNESERRCHDKLVAMAVGKSFGLHFWGPLAKGADSPTRECKLLSRRGHRTNVRRSSPGPGCRSSQRRPSSYSPPLGRCLSTLAGWRRSRPVLRSPGMTDHG